MKNVLLLLLTFSLCTINAQTEWELKKEEEGISAYTRSREGIKFKEYKVEMELEAGLNQALALLRDYEVYPDLFPGTRDHKVISDDFTHYVTYTRFKIPFPARDRDGVFDNTLSFNRDSKTLTINVHCLDDEENVNGKLVQIKYCEGLWEITDIGDGRLHVMNQMIVDPGGMAPAWIVNSKTVDDPIKTFKAFKQLIEDQKYQKSSFSLLSQ